MTPHTRVLLATALVAAVAPAARPDTGTALDFVHIEANVGGASGGHTALRLDDRVWHYQLCDDELLTLKREDWQLFRFKYNVLQNRPLHVARVPVENDSLARVRDHLNGVHQAQHRVSGEGGVDDAAATCQTVMKAIAGSADALDIASQASPDDVFKRLGGS